VSIRDIPVVIPVQSGLILPNCSELYDLVCPTTLGYPTKGTPWTPLVDTDLAEQLLDTP